MSEEESKGTAGRITYAPPSNSEVMDTEHSRVYSHRVGRHGQVESSSSLDFLNHIDGVKE